MLWILYLILSPLREQAIETVNRWPTGIKEEGDFFLSAKRKFDFWVNIGEVQDPSVGEESIRRLSDKMVHEPLNL
jgi:hypothetical protein